ncbi:MAG: hypothetical protein R2688_09825 [Fimbriimonadaceae bacterium]
MFLQSIEDDPGFGITLEPDQKAFLKTKFEEVQSSGIPSPTIDIANAIWFVVVVTICLVILGICIALVANLGKPLDPSKNYIVSGETLLAIFTTTIGFLAGLLSPSPFKSKNGGGEK